ncbi:hypothetical protein A2U01_0047296, partial [Trifolium medium]|nr:hypothetical protein [Trifolium medium]
MIKPESLVARMLKARWRIGDRTKVQVMHDPWFRIPGSSWIPSPQSQE